jgi:hypothetical protein
MNKAGLIGVLLLVIFMAAVVYGTLGLRKYRVEVCMTFQGQMNCRVAAAATKEQALRTATDNACALLASGMTASIQCSSTPPTSVRWLDED